MKTMFPALRAAKAIDLVLKNVVVTDTNNVQFMSCDIYLAGNKLGSYVHQGNGGDGHFNLVRSDSEILQAQMRKARMPILPTGEDPSLMQIGPYADSAIINLICEVVMLNAMKRHCKKNTVIVFTHSVEGEYNKYPRPFTDESRSAAVAKFGDSIAYFVNEDVASTEAL